MGRPKGSKNKAGFKKGYGESLRSHLCKVFDKKLITKTEELSFLSGITLREVANDALAEGLTCLETEAYAELIRFRQRRGKVVYERELAGNGAEVEGAAQGEAGEGSEDLLGQVYHAPEQPDSNPAGYNDAIERPGFSTEDTKNSVASDAGAIVQSLVSDEDILF